MDIVDQDQTTRTVQTDLGSAQSKKYDSKHFEIKTFYHRLEKKRLQMTISHSMKLAESSPKGKKILWKKEKLLVTSIFSFSHTVFKRPVLKTRKKLGLVWEGVN